ncbi:MAG: hypothetical protein M1833_003453 [Piccolia ochrophora]|nr:MAG: hypothetical protein M1833_003453 [Piccolia ochrophora]
MSRGGKLAPEVNRALFVKNLSYNVSPEELFDLFGKFGPVRQIRQGIANNTKGTAFVVYEDVMDAKQACDKLNGFNFQNRYLVGLPPTPTSSASSGAAGSFTLTSTAIAAIISIGQGHAASGGIQASATVLSALATSTANPTHRPDGDDEISECRLLGPFSLLVQGALGLLALSSLVWKRSRERPQRPLKIWAFDASKQVFGSVLVHIANLVMSMLSAGQFSVKVTNGKTPGAEDGYRPNPCSFYLLNLAIDTTLGIPILVLLLKLLTYAFSLTPFGQPPESIQSGHYGRPPRVVWWLKQSLIYFMGLMGMKICVLIIFNLMPWISRIGDWALKWTEGNVTLQITFVMLLFPVTMNALQYYIIDSFIKEKDSNEHEAVPTNDQYDVDSTRHSVDSGSPAHSPTHSASMQGSEQAVGNEDTRGKDARLQSRSGEISNKREKVSENGSRLNLLPAEDSEDEAASDGEESPTVGGGGSNGENDRLLSSGKKGVEEESDDTEMR